MGNRSFRPKYGSGTKKDANHKVPLLACRMWAQEFPPEPNAFGTWRGKYRNYPFELHDMSQYGGELLDWMVIFRDLVWFVEIKAERPPAKGKRRKSNFDYYCDKLSVGEQSFIAGTSANCVLVWNEESFWRYMQAAAEYLDYRDEAEFTLQFFVDQEEWGEFVP